jgi:hypothetical protein
VFLRRIIHFSLGVVLFGHWCFADSVTVSSDDLPASLPGSTAYPFTSGFNLPPYFWFVLVPAFDKYLGNLNAVTIRWTANFSGAEVYVPGPGELPVPPAVVQGPLDFTVSGTGSVDGFSASVMKDYHLNVGYVGHCSPTCRAGFSFSVGDTNRITGDLSLFHSPPSGPLDVNGYVTLPVTMGYTLQELPETFFFFPRLGALDLRLHWTAIVTYEYTPFLGSYSLWSATTLRLGQTTRLPVSISVPAPPSGVNVSLASSDASSVYVTPSVFISAGRTTPNIQPMVTGLNPGRVDITASGDGYRGNSQTVTVLGSIAFARCCIGILGPVTQNAVLNLSGPASAPLTVNLSSENPAVATVPASVTFPANTTTMNVPITGILRGGSTVIHASALPNLADTTLRVSVALGP